MNGDRHSALPMRVLGELHLDPSTRCLDVGCGGGANIARLLDLCPDGHVTGIETSPLAIDVSTDVNFHAVVDGKCAILGGDATRIPLAREVFDLVTAFETVYYWPSLDKGIAECMRVLKPGGMLVVANERDGLVAEDDALSRGVFGMSIYTPQEIVQSMAQAGCIDIVCKHDEQRHFVCVTARK